MAVLPEDILAHAEELLELAEALPDIPRREVLCRASIGRAYYAVYHKALELAREGGYTSPPASYASHAGLWDWWFVEQEANLDLSQDGNALKWLRQRADYRLRETFAPSLARHTLAAAQETFRAINAR